MSEFDAFVNKSALVLDDGQLDSVYPLSTFLWEARHLTGISISEDVSIPDPSDKQTAQQYLVTEILRAKNPNLLEVNIAGANSTQQLDALCDTNRRAANHLLAIAKNPSHSLTPNECKDMETRLPAMLAIARSTGASQSEHSMTHNDINNMLERLASAGVSDDFKRVLQAEIARLAPAPAPVSVAAAPAPQLMSGHVSTEGTLVALMRQGALRPMGS